MTEKKENHSIDILALQEAERRRIAEDLHDTTVQELVALSQQLDLANLYFDKDVIQAKLELAYARKQIRKIINGIRETIYDLRPMTLDDIGWEAAIERIKQDICNKSDIRVIYNIDKIPNLDKTIEITLYRIIREAVNNVYHHAKATVLEVSLHVEKDNIVLQVWDDGIGISEKIDDNHFGMKFMLEKAKLLNGDMNVITSDEGTQITVIIPI